MDEDIVGVLFILLILFSFFSFIIYTTNLKVEAESRAQELCQAKGYETFITFQRTILSSKPKALICGSLEDRMKYEGKIKVYNFQGNQSIVKIIGDDKK